MSVLYLKKIYANSRVLAFEPDFKHGLSCFKDNVKISKYLVGEVELLKIDVEDCEDERLIDLVKEYKIKLHQLLPPRM